MMTEPESQNGIFDLTTAVANRFATNTGGLTTGTCSTSGTACTLQRMLAVIQCGEIGELASGTVASPRVYTGSASMLTYVSVSSGSFVCSLGNEITIRAAVEGGAVINGEYSRAPCVFGDSGTHLSYWKLIGFNCIRPAASALVLRNLDHFTLQRMIFVDGNGITNDPAIQLWDATDVLLEDVASFGLGKKPIDEFGGIARNKYRRVWLRNEGGASQLFAAQTNYTDVDWPTPSLWENVIFTIAPSTRMPFPVYPCCGAVPAEPFALFDVRHSALSPYVRFMGVLAYPTTSYTPWLSGHLFRPEASVPYTVSGFILQDTLLHTNGKTVTPVYIGNGLLDGPLRLQQLTRVTSVGSGSTIHASTTITPSGSFIEQTTLGATGFDWIGTGNTAKLCKRYVDGTYTGTNLWPWPMDDRIKAAIAFDPGGATGGASPTLLGSAGTGYAANTVTSEVVSLLGAIPAGCIN